METKRCPFCKLPKPWIVRIHPLRGVFTKYYVECRSCHFCGKTKIGKKRAIKAWNRLYAYGVEVVRCRDCTHWSNGDCYRLEMSKPDDFCSYGEPKEKEK